MTSNAAKMQSTSGSRARCLFKVTTSLTFALGVAIHAGRIFMGPERFGRVFFTPPVEVAFAVLILVAAVAGLLA
jgi:hypothetical protein